MNKHISQHTAEASASKLFGRDELLESQVHQILSTEGYIGAIHGVSGVGKSAVASHVHALLGSSSHPDVSSVYFEVVGAQDAEEPFLSLYDEIYKEVKLSALTKIRSALNRSASRAVKGLIAALFKDAAKTVGANVENTIGAVDKIASDAEALISDEKLRAKIKDSNYSTLLAYLSAAAQKTARTHVLILDGLENASERSIRFIRSLVGNLPANIRVLLFINSEVQAFQGDAFQKLTAKLQYHCPECIRELNGLTKEDVVIWRNSVTGQSVSDAIASTALEQANGRPLFLQPWIQDASGDLGLIPQHGTKLFGYYKEKYLALSNGCLAILNLLAAAFPHILASQELKSASGQTQQQLNKALISLNNDGFVEEKHGGYRCKHVLIAKYIEAEIPTQMLTELKAKLHRLFSRHHAGIAVAHSSRAEALMAETVTIDAGRDGLQFLVAYSKKLLSAGAYQSAEEKLTEVGSLIAQNVPTTDSERIALASLRAELFRERGQYEESLTELDTTDGYAASNSERAGLHVARGDAFFRLNQYTNAVSHFKQARKLAAQDNIVSLYATAIIRLLQVTSDIGKLDKSRRIASTLLRDTLPVVQAGADLKTECHIYRAVARVIAPVEPDAALRYAINATRLANEIESDRVRGNCAFAQGEVYRHASRYQEAESSYRVALEIGTQTGNKDLSIYSLMALTVLAIIQNEQDQLSEALDMLSSEIDYNAPVEAANTDLFKQIYASMSGAEIQVNQLGALRELFNSLQRKWQSLIIDDLQSNHAKAPEALPKRLREMQIVF